VPYLYSDDDITALIAAAGGLPSPLSALTLQTLIGLLPVTGLRIAEALALDRADFDIDHALLTVHDGKLGKSRLIPLHPTAVEALTAYLRRRDELYPQPVTTALFISAAGTRKRYACLRTTFARLLYSAHVQPRSGRCRPRLHDMRH
jgi:integrase